MFKMQFDKRILGQRKLNLTIFEIVFQNILY